MTTGIVGATGFIGSYFTKFIGGKEHGGLRLMVRNSVGCHCPPGSEVLHGDLLSLADCERFAKGLKVIYYLAHNNSPVNSDFDWPSDARGNIILLLNLLQTVRDLETKPHIVYFSSGGAVYAPKADRIPYRETDHCGPMNSYGIQKLAAEEYLRLAAHKGLLTATVLRVGNAYGTLLSQFRLQGIIGVAINCVAHGQPVRLFGNPNNIRDYIHLEDVSDLAVRVSTPREPYSVINVGSGMGHSVMDILRLIEESLGRPIEVHADQSLGNSLTDWIVLDNARARERYGWKPALDLREGIARMAAGVR